MSMKRQTIAFAAMAVLVAGSAMAQTAPPPTTPPPATNPAGQKPATPAPTPTPTPVPFPAEAKVAFIDLQAVVQQSKLGKKGRDAMQVLNDKLSADLAAKNKEIQALQDRMKTQQGVVSEAVFNNMAKELDKLQREAQFKQQDAQVQIDQLNQELLATFQQQVLPIVEKLREERGLWIIFALGDNSNIAAAHAGLDLSAEIVKRLDATIK
ncbi:MAG TPA: OmpH family outer membrane protein [Vicinamibacterales bacterium]|nr:OmpH family outer membrane protein [Vicinamibacterales bacterium]